VYLPNTQSRHLQAQRGYAILRETCSRRRIVSLLVGAFLWYEACNRKGVAMSEQDGDLTFFAGLVVGAIVGGFAAALLAPRSGPETREQIVERGLELKNRAEDVVERAQQVAGETVAKVQAAAQEMIGHSSSPTPLSRTAS
jgi:hypothetical protein